MDRDEVLNNYYMQENALVKYGFKRLDNLFIVEKTLKNNEFYARFEISNSCFNIDVFENNGANFLPFYIKNVVGGYTALIKEEVASLTDEILKSCFKPISIRKKILAYVNDKYQTEADYPWTRDPMSATLKILETKKWYGLIINIPYRCLNIDKEGKVDILNVKNTPEKINALIDHIHYFPAYHMNKKHWISILLDRTVQITQVEKLLDESYQLVTKK